MRYLLLVTLLGFLSISAIAQPTKVKLKPMEGYQIIDDKALKKGLNLLVITNRKDFDKVFGVTRRPDTPDFSKEQLLVMALPATTKEARLSFDRILWKAGDRIEVYCTVDKNLYPLTYTTYPIVMGTIPIYPSVKEIHFYREKGMKLLDVVRVD